MEPRPGRGEGGFGPAGGGRAGRSGGRESTDRAPDRGGGGGWFGPAGGGRAGRSGGRESTLIGSMGLHTLSKTDGAPGVPVVRGPLAVHTCVYLLTSSDPCCTGTPGLT